jgi:hypothetical protein
MKLATALVLVLISHGVAPAGLPVAATVTREPAGVVTYASDPADACCRVGRGIFAGSGTCVWSEGGKSLVLTNNHIFSETYDAEGGTARASYPLTGCYVQHKGKSYPARAVDGLSSRWGDLAFLEVEAELPVAEVADDVPPLGAVVWHRGTGSGGGSGRMLPNPAGHFWPSSLFTSSMPSISGDSGAGIFNEAGQLVGINCGRQGVASNSPQRGTPVKTIREFLKTRAAGLFPNLAKRLGAVRSAVKARLNPDPKKDLPRAAEPPKPKTDPAPPPKVAPAAADCPPGMT